MSVSFQPGIDVLLSRHRNWIAGKRVGLVSHAAATDSNGVMTADRLHQAGDITLACLFGPEHGFQGTAAAGARCRNARHPSWNIPVYSLYGSTRRPTTAMLEGLDIIVYDIQDIGARAYTYVSTLKEVLIAAAAAGCPVVVADRPIPLPGTTDGPVTRPAFASFVSHIETPLSYGMTPGETALWLNRTLDLELDLRIARMRGYRRDYAWGANWPPWTPPSPAMRSWESARCFPATVLFEALPALDHARRTPIPFQLVGSAWLDTDAILELLNGLRLPGVSFLPERYWPDQPHTQPALDGIRIAISEPRKFRPALTGIALIYALQRIHGIRKVWAGARTEFFDKLCGTDDVRKALLAGRSPSTIAAAWRAGITRFRRSRSRCLLYRERSNP